MDRVLLTARTLARLAFVLTLDAAFLATAVWIGLRLLRSVGCLP